jgi:hypothetical protein
MPATARLSKSKQTETDIAVLQVQVAGLDEKIDDLKSDIKEIKDALQHHSETSLEVMNSFKKENADQHNELAKKVSALEKWRYMMIGAGLLAGAMGFSAAKAILVGLG